MTTRRRKEPTPASLRELPPVDFARYRVRRNPFSDEIARTGAQVVHDEPSERSVTEIPEVDLTAARVRRNPYASRAAEALANLQVGRGRPRDGYGTGPTTPRSIRLPQSVWDALEAEARRSGTTVHALLRKAVTAFLLGREQGSPGR